LIEEIGNFNSINPNFNIALNDLLLHSFNNKNSINYCKEKNISSNKIKNVFIFIVDALRLDFVVKKSNTSDNTINDLDSPFNQFKNIHNLLMQNASQSILFCF
jgi:hypothetical protein